MAAEGSEVISEEEKLPLTAQVLALRPPDHSLVQALWEGA